MCIRDSSYEKGEPIEDYAKDFSINYSLNAVNSNKFTFGGLLQYDSNNNPTSYKFNVTNHVANIIRYDSLNIDLGLTTTSDINDISTRKGYFLNMEKVILPSPSLSLPLPVVLFGSNPGQDNFSKSCLLYTSDAADE